jgi:hypothetical protein
MSSWRDSSLVAYRRLTQPLRWWQGRCWRQSEQYPIVVLFYHRVADHDLTDWTMTRADFRAQLDWVQASLLFWAPSSNPNWRHSWTP